MSKNQSRDEQKFIAEHPKMKKLLEQVEKAAKSRATVYLYGETGTGKEVIAKEIHTLSGCKGKFVAVNCASIPENLVESMLFGHKKGAFTTAFQDQKGKFEEAENGTIFLDEITEIPKAAQPDLLRVTQEKEITPVGSNKVIKVNARIITATNKDLLDEVEKGEFRKDLYYRLNVIRLNIPLLRERKCDLEVLAKLLLEKFAREENKKTMTFSEDAISILMSYEWPGNVRELENVILRAVVMADDDTTTLRKNDLFPERIPDSSPPPIQAVEDSSKSLQEKVNVLEKFEVGKSLSKHKWVKVRVCKELDITRPRLDRLIKKHKF